MNKYETQINPSKSNQYWWNTMKYLCCFKLSQKHQIVVNFWFWVRWPKLQPNIWILLFGLCCLNAVVWRKFGRQWFWPTQQSFLWIYSHHAILVWVGVLQHTNTVCYSCGCVESSKLVERWKNRGKSPQKERRSNFPRCANYCVSPCFCGSGGSKS